MHLLTPNSALLLPDVWLRRIVWGLKAKPNCPARADEDAAAIQV
jgi:hypothetical protein